LQLLDDGTAVGEGVIAFILALGFQLRPQATCRGGRGLTRHSHDVRVRLGALTIWRLQCPTCRAMFTIRPHVVVRERQMHPEVAREALLATPGGLRLARWAVLAQISPRALERRVCTRGQHRLVRVLTRGGRPLPTDCWADEQPRHGLPAHVDWPTSVRGRVLWPLGYTKVASRCRPCGHHGWSGQWPARTAMVSGQANWLV
jgi:hypothetical protein